MSDLHNLLTGLVGLPTDERQAAYRDNTDLLFRPDVVAYVAAQRSEAAIDAESFTSAGGWSSVPEFITDTYAEGARQWAIGVDEVWSEMVAFAEKHAPPESSSPRPGPGSTTASSSSGFVADTGVATGPTDDEILQDHVEFVRQEQVNFQNDLDFNRISDDAIAYSAPSYDPYDSY